MGSGKASKNSMLRDLKRFTQEFVANILIKATIEFHSVVLIEVLYYDQRDGDL